MRKRYVLIDEINEVTTFITRSEHTNFDKDFKQISVKVDFSRTTVSTGIVLKSCIDWKKET